MNRVSSLNWLLACCTLLALAGCFSQSDSNTLRNKTIIYCSEGAPESFNPQLVTSMITIDATSHQIYNRLLEFQTDGTDLAPALANSWHVTRDGKIITFYLRKDVDFHETSYFKPTRKFNADDVIFTFNRILDENHPFHHVGGAKYPFFQSVGFADLVNEIEKINEYTIRFKLNYPDSSFLANLATDFAVILSKEYADQLALQNNHGQIDYIPIGTGPYIFKNYVQGSFVRYYRNPNYWRHEVKVEQLLFDVTPSNTGRLTKLLTEECDIISYPIAHQQIKDAPKLELEQVTSFNVGYLAFNTLKKPYDNPLVRKAIAHAIDKDSIVDIVYDGQATVANSLLPDQSWAFSADVSTPVHSVELARTLLTEAGYASGFEMDMWAMPIQRAYNPNAKKMAKLMQANLARVGIRVNIIEDYEWRTFLRMVANGEHEVALVGWSADHPDPDNFFTPLLSCNANMTGNNRALWCNEEFDELLYQALSTNNPLSRKKYYVEAQKIIAEQLPVLPIAHAQRFQAKQNSVKGDILTPFGGVDLSKVERSESVQ